MLRVNEFFGGACYHNKKTREWVATTLILKSIKFFYNADTIKQCGPLYEIFSQEKDTVELLKKSTNLLETIQNPLLDSIAIVIALENYFKAVLLLKGYVIHKVDKNQNDSLFNNQKRNPLLISDLKNIEGVSYNKKNNYSFRLLSYNTIGLDLFLKKTAYKNVLKITSDMCSILDRIKSYRNSLHFLVGENSAWNTDIFLDYKQLIKFSNSNLISTYNRLVRKLTFFRFYCEYDKKKYSVKFIEINS